MAMQSTTDIARDMGRSIWSVESRLHRLGFRLSRRKAARVPVRPVGRAIEVVCRVLECTPKDLMSRSRVHPWPQRRFLVYWLARQMGASNTFIARNARVDHSTVFYGCRRIEGLREKAISIRNLSDRLLAELEPTS